MKPKIAILSFSNIASDGRVLRQIAAVSSVYEVDVFGYGQWQPPSGVRFVSIPRLDSFDTSWSDRLLRLYRYFLIRFHPASAQTVYWSRQSHREALNMLQKKKYHLIHANDWEALPVAALAARHSGARLLYDAHEYTPDQDTGLLISVLLWRSYRVNLLKQYAGRVNGFITVSEGLARLYQEHFGWDCTVIKNVPFYQEVLHRSVFHDRVQLVYHGAAARNRRLEDLIDLIRRLDRRFILSLVLLQSDLSYIKALRNMAERLANGRVVFLSPWAANDIVNHLSCYDVGLAILPSNRVNHIYGLPNKFFEYAMAGLGIAVLSSSLEMAGMVEKYDLGVTGASIQDIAEKFNNLADDQINIYKRNSLAFAKEVNGEAEMKKLLQVYEKLLGEG